jgi:DNA helicase-2/ATP-dependent DNA helicase PcrA
MREQEPSLGGFVDRLSLLSEADEETGAKDARVWLMTMHAAKGLEFPLVVIGGMEDGLFPHSRSSNDEEELEEERRLCYVAMTRAKSKLVLTGAARRRTFGEYSATNPSRFLDEIPSELVDVIAPAYPAASSTYTHAHYEFRTNPYGRKGRGSRFREDSPAYSYEDEDQSASPLRPGMRVKHATFGVGTVLSIEEHTDDFKITVRFASVGQKKLLAKFAKLEPA